MFCLPPVIDAIAGEPELDRLYRVTLETWTVGDETRWSVICEISLPHFLYATTDVTAESEKLDRAFQAFCAAYPLQNSGEKSMYVLTQEIDKAFVASIGGQPIYWWDSFEHDHHLTKDFAYLLFAYREEEYALLNAFEGYSARTPHCVHIPADSDIEEVKLAFWCGRCGAVWDGREETAQPIRHNPGDPEAFDLLHRSCGGKILWWTHLEAYL